MMPEDAIRLSFFMGVLIALMAAEFFFPRRTQIRHRHNRWPHNLALAALNIALVRLVFPLSLAGFCQVAAHKGWGIFNVINAPFWMVFLLSVVLLDMLVYGQHVLFHKFRLLWRLHRVHHTDTEFDVTTALRFHPLEILISMLIKFAAAILLGVPPAAAMAFEIILNASALFNHGNVNIPKAADAGLRLLIVTPDMHRVHHSVLPVETDSNYGFCLSLWDRIFGTYRGRPSGGHETMRLGLETHRETPDQRLDRLILQPFIDERPPCSTQK